MSYVAILALEIIKEKMDIGYLGHEECCYSAEKKNLRREKKGKGGDNEPCDVFKSLRFKTSLQMIVIAMQFRVRLLK